MHTSAMKKLSIAIFILFSVLNVSKAQTRGNRNYYEVAALGGFGHSKGASHAQFVLRGSWNWRRIAAMGAEGAFGSVVSQYQSFDAASITGYMRVKMPLGVYTEGGYGIAKKVSEGRNGLTSLSSGIFIAAGFRKSFGPRFGVDVQWRRSGANENIGNKQLQNGWRFGVCYRLF